MHFKFSFNLIGKLINDANQGGYSNPGEQMKDQDKNFGAVLQMDLTRSFVLFAAQARKNWS